MNNIKLGFSMLARDWRAGEWRILLIALVLAVGSISTVGLFSDRVRQALQQEAHSLLGADLNSGPCGCEEESSDPRWTGLP